ncbi:MAG: amidophosphoribosyltransferase, partial [Armatimonadetes bacterium]|nr:amidophosphoribosyltransferase [Armatimonadota bacterium]
MSVDLESLGLIDDHPAEECAVVGIYAPGHDVSRLAYFALYALQHRGQESSGIAVSDGKQFECYKDMGLVSQVFNPEILQRLQGHLAVAHNRYSTTGSSRIDNAQPLLLKSHLGQLALAHNGNLTNYLELKNELLARGLTFATTSDTEVVLKIFSLAEGDTLAQKLVNTVRRLFGSYSVVLATPDALMGFRDPLGVRPLCIGRIGGERKDDGWVLASESCGLATIGATFVREVRPGEAVIIDRGGLQSVQAAELEHHALCLFEYVYFARPDTLINGDNIYNARYRMGQHLAREYPADADLVIAVPDSGVPAAMGYADESGIPYGEGLIKNRYIARTFIQPDDNMRKVGIKLKFNPLTHNIHGKRIVMIDDSIVRGNTTRALVKLLKDEGVKEVHVRITSPPMIHPCFYGVDTATHEQLIAHKYEVPDICKYIGADSLGYLSLDALMEDTGY